MDNRIAKDTEINQIIKKQTNKDGKNNKKIIYTAILCAILLIIGLIVGFLIGRLTKKKGDVGEKGDTGISGKDGIDGKDGKDASCDNDTCTKHQNLSAELYDKKEIITRIENTINDTSLDDTNKIKEIKNLI